MDAGASKEALASEVGTGEAGAGQVGARQVGLGQLASAHLHPAQPHLCTLWCRGDLPLSIIPEGAWGDRDKVGHNLRFECARDG